MLCCREFHIVTLYRKFNHLFPWEVEAPPKAPADGGSFVDDDDWGSDGGDDAWADDEGDWKRKKRSVVEESPSERWTRETHEVKIMEYLIAACGEGILQRGQY